MSHIASGQVLSRSENVTRAHVQLMGGFGVFHDGRPIDLPDSTRQLIAYLAISDGPQERALVAAILWPEKTEQRAAANLRSSIWRLSAVSDLELMSVHRSCIELDPSVSVDVRQLQQTGWDLVHRDSQSMIAADLDRGVFAADLLPGWYADWVIAERERLTQLQLHFMEALAYTLVREGNIPEALDVAIRLVAADPLREGSQRVLLWTYCSEGSLGQARRQFDRYRRALRDEFGLEPTISLAALLDEVGSDAPCGDSSASATRSRVIAGHRN